MTISSYLEGSIIEVTVGVEPQQQSFFLYQRLLAARSRYCRNLFNTLEIGEDWWAENTESVVQLPEDDPELFRSYVQILHQKKIPQPQSLLLLGADDVAARNEQEVYQKDIDAAIEAYRFLANLYVLCEKMQDCESKCIVITGFIELANKPRKDGHHHLPSFGAIRCLYNGIQDDDPMGELLVELYASSRDSTWLLSVEEDDVPNAFLIDVTKRMQFNSFLGSEVQEG